MINTQTDQCYPVVMWGHQNYDVDTCDIVEEQPQIQESSPSVLIEKKKIYLKSLKQNRCSSLYAYVLTKKTGSSTAIVSHSFFTKKIDNDRTEQSLVQLEQIPLEKFVQPFVVAQNSNNALIRMKDGSLLILENTNAKQIHESLLSRAYKAMDLTAPSSDNTLTVYMLAGHAFVGLDCTSCADGNPYHETFGLYPSFIKGRGLILDEKHRGLPYAINPDFQAAFPITDEQALAVMNKKESENTILKNPKYNLFTRNCVDFAMEFAPIIGEPHFIDFTPKIQLNLNPNDLMNVASEGVSSAAHQFAVLKYKVGANQDNLLVGASATSLVITYVVIKTFAQLSRLFRKTETPPKPSLTIKMLTVALIQTGSVLAARVAIGPQYPQAMQIIRLAAMAIPATTVAKEIQSQEALDKNKKPSLWNKRISFMLGLWAIMGVALQIAVKSTEIIVGEELCPQATTATYATYAIGGTLLAFNTLRNFYHDITEALGDSVSFCL